MASDPLEIEVRIISPKWIPTRPIKVIKVLNYYRVGHIASGTFSDQCVAKAVELLPQTDPSIKLPKFWRYQGPERFMERFGGGVVWSKAASYHQLFINGQRVCKLWTLSPKTLRLEWYDKSSISFKEMDEFQKYFEEKVKGRYGL